MSTVAMKRDDLEQRIQDASSVEEAWAFVEQAMSMIRLSGGKDEERAIAYLGGRLSEWGVPFQVHRPTTFISWPLKATLRLLGSDGFTLTAKNPSMSVSTNGIEHDAEMMYLPTSYAKDVTDIFSAGEIADVDLLGKVVVTEGLAMPGKVQELTNRGAIAAVFVGPGERIHEGICTTIWGSPDLDSMYRQPRIPILAVNRSEGDRLIEVVKAGGKHVAYSTNLETSWRQIPILEAVIKGSSAPEEFVLLHGHLDSWHEGIGDNATGNALLLELARLLKQFQGDLARTVKIVWWSGHSHGRYAGSTWYADAHAIDLAENCVAHINCDSPGCRWTTTYTDAMWTEEARPMAAEVIEEVTGITPEWARPLRAGDYSFSNLGITGILMLSSTMAAELRAEKGYYPVGGCGGNIAWHTEDDVLEIADPDNLARDIRVYAALVTRAANSAIPPFDFRLTVDQMTETLADYQQHVGNDFDFGPAVDELAALKRALDEMYARFDLLGEVETGDPRARRATRTLISVARLLVPVNYARAGRFWQDPAENVAPLPDLAIVKRLAKMEPDSHEYHAGLVSLLRGMNRLIYAVRRAADIADGQETVIE